MIYALSSQLSEVHRETSGDASTTLEMTIVILILMAAVGSACWWAFQRVRRAQDPCEGCDGCQLKELKEHAKACKKQKNSCCTTKK